MPQLNEGNSGHSHNLRIPRHSRVYENSQIVNSISIWKDNTVQSREHLPQLVQGASQEQSLHFVWVQFKPVGSGPFQD